MEEKIENNRAGDLNKALRERIRTLDQEYEVKLTQKMREIKDLESRIIILSANKEEIETILTKSQATSERLSLELKTKSDAVKRLEDEIVENEAKYR